MPSFAANMSKKPNSKAILVLHGPNLNLLGSREPEVYGKDTLLSIEERLAELANEAGHELSAFQSNAEHELIERLHAAPQAGVAFLIFNPGRLRIRVSPCATHCSRYACPSSKCICRTPTRARAFAAIRISRISPWVQSWASAPSATSSRCAPQSANCSHDRQEVVLAWTLEKLKN